MCKRQVQLDCVDGQVYYRRHPREGGARCLLSADPTLGTFTHTLSGGIK